MQNHQRGGQLAETLADIGASSHLLRRTPSDANGLTEVGNFRYRSCWYHAIEGSVFDAAFR